MIQPPPSDWIQDRSGEWGPARIAPPGPKGVVVGGARRWAWAWFPDGENCGAVIVRSGPYRATVWAHGRTASLTLQEMPDDAVMRQLWALALDSVRETGG